MTERQQEVTDVEVILKDGYPGGNVAALAELRAHGLAVSDVNDEIGFVEGTIGSHRLAEISALGCVSDVRHVLTYIADEEVEGPEGGR